MTHHSAPPSPIAETREAALCRRAFRFRRRGERRRAMLLLREAAYGAEDDARLWVFYGVQCARNGKVGEATRAITHAAWLRERHHEPEKARVTRSLLSRLPEDRAA